jgi:hypothetical protein
VLLKRLALALLGATLVAFLPLAPGDAREGDASPVAGSRVHRVTMRGAGSAKHIFWVELEGPSSGAMPPTTLYVGALPPELDVGDRFDIIDVHGYVGRVTIASVESRPLACPGSEYRRGWARFDGPPEREPSTPAVAIGPVGRVPLRARIIAPEEVKGPPPPSRQDTLDRLLVDMDGDDTPDLMRHYYYCPSASQGGRMAFCFEIWARQGSKWRMVEDTRIDNCY